jgi:hypothetical protein
MRATLNRTLGVSAATVVALGLTCCARQPEAAQHTVAEYRANADLRREQFARCTNDPGTLGKTPDCVNALEAERLVDIGSVRDTPPIELPRPGGKH